MRPTVILLLLLLSGFSVKTRAQAIVTTPDTIAACLGDTIVINLLLNDLGDDLELIEFSEIPASGSFSFLPDGTITFIPDPDDFNSFQEISYLVCEDDDDDDCAVEQVTFYLQAYSDCVWPGDANVDGFSNHFDLLNIGLFYNDAGPDRYDEDNSWDATYADIWEDVAPIGSNIPKFADCNGNGIVDVNDTLSIALNYGLLHPLRTEEFTEFDATPLYIDITEDTLPFDTTLTFPIILGNDEFPAEDIYGLGFTIEYNSDLVVPGSMDIQFNDGWLGTEGSNLIAMRYGSGTGLMDVSVSRNNKIPASGSGQIGTVSFVMESNLAGKSDLLLAEQFEMCMNPLYKAVDANGNDITLSPGCDSVLITDGAADTVIYDIDIIIFPNPAASFVKVKLPGIEPVDALVEIKNLMGTTLRSTNIVNGNQTKMKVSNIPNGTYNMVITLPYTVVSEPFIILH